MPSGYLVAGMSRVVEALLFRPNDGVRVFRTSQHP